MQKFDGDYSRSFCAVFESVAGRLLKLVIPVPKEHVDSIFNWYLDASLERRSTCDVLDGLQVQIQRHVEGAVVLVENMLADEKFRCCFKLDHLQPFLEATVKGYDAHPHLILSTNFIDSHVITVDDFSIPRQSYPRFWELLRYILGRKLREQVFEPAYNDLLADHLTTRAARFQTPWARRWIRFCFAVRTLRLIVECAFVGVRGKVMAAILSLPLWKLIRDWWQGG